MATKEYTPTGFWGLIASVVGKLASNIHGTDATMLALCGMMYLILITEKAGENPLVGTVLDYVFYLACIVMIGRVLITWIKKK